MVVWRGESMNAYVVSLIIPLIVLAINCVAAFHTFPRKYSLRATIGALVLFTATLLTFHFLTGTLQTNFRGVRGLLYLPVIILLFEGLFFQKVFAVFLHMLVTTLQAFLVSAIVKIFVPDESRTYYLILLVLILIMYAVYVILMYKFGRTFLKRLFASGSSSDWMLYSLGILFSFVMLIISIRAHMHLVLYILLLLFILFSIGLLCFAIIKAQEKSKQLYEAEFTRDMISAGSDHYQKMIELYESFRILRQDYEYHMNVVRELLTSGNQTEAEDYLNGIELHLSDYEPSRFCKDSVINTLLASFSDRCKKLNIRYDTEITIPDSISVPNHELCIILGNLLENAVEACGNSGHGRRIELIVKPQGSQLAIMVKNNFSGNMIHNDNQLVSTKKSGGFGLRGVQAVAARYQGELITEWSAEAYTAYVLIRA